MEWFGRINWKALAGGAASGASLFIGLYIWAYDPDVRLVFELSDLIGVAAVIAALLGIAVSSRMLAKQAEIMKQQASISERQVRVDEVREIQDAIASCNADQLAAKAFLSLHIKLQGFLEENLEFPKQVKVWSTQYIVCYRFIYENEIGFKKFSNSSYREVFMEFRDQANLYFTCYSVIFGDDPEDIIRYYDRGSGFDKEIFLDFLKKDDGIADRLNENGIVCFEDGGFFTSRDFQSFQAKAVALVQESNSRIESLRREIAILYHGSE